MRFLTLYHQSIKVWRGWVGRRRYLRTLKAARRIQEFFFSWKLRFTFIQQRRAAVVIQAHLRGTLFFRIYFLFFVTNYFDKR